MSTRIAVLGAGANGASIGADLTRGGLDVTLIEQWPDHVRAMRRSGLRINMPTESLKVSVRVHDLCDVATFTEQFDVVLIVMKAYDTRWATQLIEPYVKDDGLVVGVQNGMTTDTIADVVGEHRTIGSVIECSSELVVPGVVDRHTAPDRSWFAVGGIEKSPTGREAEIADLLNHSGTVQLVADIRAAKWMKLVSNCTTLVLTAILDLPIAAAAAIPQVRELMVRAGREAVEAGRLLGHPVSPIFGLSQFQVGQAEGLVELMTDTLLANYVLPTTTSTVLHDWNNGRRSEVKDINGAAVAAYAKHGRHAPVNAAITEVARRIECGALKPGMNNLLLMQEMAAGPINTHD